MFVVVVEVGGEEVHKFNCDGSFSPWSRVLGFREYLFYCLLD